MNAGAGALLDHEANLVGRRLGRYEVLTKIAAGGMATIYVARVHGVAGFERLVAIKMLHPHLAYDEEFISMFLDEARLAARIRHPNVVPTLDISDSEGAGYYLVMEYVEGDHLGALMRELTRAGKLLPPQIALRAVLDALAGLSAAHQLKDEDGKLLGIVHRDISPHNVLIGSDGVCRLLDFGVAKSEVRLASTRDGQFKGKLAYMAPEHASRGISDARSDLFSMGIVLWELLTNHRLFKAENNGELLHKLLHQPVLPPSAYIPEVEPFDELCLKALDRDPNARFQTAEEMIEAIEHIANQTMSIATHRKAGKLVREALAPKLASQSRRIREAVDRLGRAEVSGIPLPSESMDAALDDLLVDRGTITGTSSLRPIGVPDPEMVSEEVPLPSAPSLPAADSIDSRVSGEIAIVRPGKSGPETRGESRAYGRAMVVLGGLAIVIAAATAFSIQREWTRPQASPAAAPGPAAIGAQRLTPEVPTTSTNTAETAETSEPSTVAGWPDEPNDEGDEDVYAPEVDALAEDEQRVDGEPRVDGERGDHPSNNHRARRSRPIARESATRGYSGVVEAVPTAGQTQPGRGQTHPEPSPATAATQSNESANAPARRPQPAPSVPSEDQMIVNPYRR